MFVLYYFEQPPRGTRFISVSTSFIIGQKQFKVAFCSSSSVHNSSESYLCFDTDKRVDCFNYFFRRLNVVKYLATYQEAFEYSNQILILLCFVERSVYMANYCYTKYSNLRNGLPAACHISLRIYIHFTTQVWKVMKVKYNTW